MHLRCLASLATLCLAIPAAAQNTNTRFLANLHDYPGYNAVHGYAVGGNEFAIWGTTLGTAFVDATDPKNPVEYAFLPGPSSNWRDMDMWGPWLYVCTEGGGGLQIIDMSDPFDPTIAGVWTGGFFSSHTLYIDKTTGNLFANGTNNGTVLVNLSSPTAPSVIAYIESPYSHDTFAQNGYLHMAAMFNGEYRLYDISSLPTITLLDAEKTPGVFTHNAWANADDTLAFTTDESGGGHLAIWNIQDKQDVQLLSEWETVGSAVIHNVYLEGNIAHCSWYTDGYVAVDVSSPSAPRMLAQYDTSPLSGGSYDGAWGAYPYQPSGVIYVNDQQEGLFLLELECRPATPYGTGLAGSSGIVPTLWEPNGLADLGNASYAIEAQNLLGGSAGLFLLGLGPTSLPVFGGQLLVDPIGMVTAPFVASGTGAGAGQAQLPLPIPPNPLLVGLQLFTQALALDPGAAQGVSFSAGLEITFCDMT